MPNPKWYNIWSLIQHLTIDVCKALPYFHAFIGCDTMSNEPFLILGWNVKRKTI